MKPVQDTTFYSIFKSSLKFNTLKIQYISMVEFFVFLVIEQKSPSCKGLNIVQVFL